MRPSPVHAAEMCENGLHGGTVEVVPRDVYGLDLQPSADTLDGLLQ